MRLRAYKVAIDEAKMLPEKITGKGYFKGMDIRPRCHAICQVLNAARLDIDGLYSSELVELIEYADGPRKAVGK